MTRKGSLAEFLSRYPPNVGEMALACADVIRSAIPNATETRDDAGHVVGYAIGPGYSGLVCTIIPGKKGVKLGIVRGRSCRILEARWMSRCPGCTAQVPTRNRLDAALRDRIARASTAR